MQKRVAIFQNTLTGGGRIKVINEIVRLLNERGMVPDIITFRATASLGKPDDISYRIKKYPQLIYGFYELKVVSLNYLMRFAEKKYDLLINSNNSLLFAPATVKTLSYIHFPREARVLSPYASLAFPDGPAVSQKGMGFRLARGLMRCLYRRRRALPNQLLAANSEFTKAMFSSAYPQYPAEDIRVIYPPVPIESWQGGEARRENVVTSLGRFSKDKRQLEQIKIAERLPELQFQIIGFVGDSGSRHYFQQCQAYIAQQRIKNVALFPGLSGQETRERLQKSRFFLHNLRNEPFGISTVEAIAAGCLPVVHNSGGQKEIVPDEELRFDDAEEAVRRLRAVAGTECGDRLKLLQSHLVTFNTQEFQRRMQLCLAQALNEI